MSGWVTALFDDCVDGSRWRVYSIPSTWTASRSGVAVLRFKQTSGPNDALIYVGGLITARQASSLNYGGTINAYVPAGVEVKYLLQGSRLVSWSFIEL